MDVVTLNALIDGDNTGTIAINEGVIISHNDVLNLKGKTIEITADPAITINGAHWSILHGKLRAMTGVLFDCVSSSSGLMLNVWATGLLRVKELFRCVGTNSCYDTNIIGGEWAKPQGMLSPVVRVEVDGPFYNSNRWCGLRMQTNGRPLAPVIKLACTHNANWIYGNTIEHMNFEIPNAGAIHLESCFGTRMNQINVFDANLFGDIIDDIIKVTKSLNGLRSKSTALDGYIRLSGSLVTGKVDINIQESGHYPQNIMVRMVQGIDGAALKVKLPIYISNEITIQAQFV